MNTHNDEITNICEQNNLEQPPNNKYLDNIQLYYNHISSFPLLKAKEEYDLVKKISQGDRQARNIMIMSNLRLVAKIARFYLDRGLPFLDLIQEGNLGLMHAITKFDPDKGNRFSTYATYWIKERIECAINTQVRTVRLPIHTIKKRNTYLRHVSELSQEMKVLPTRNDIINKFDYQIDDIIQMEYLTEKIIPLDTASSDIDNSLSDMFIDDESHNPEQQVISDSLNKTIVNYLYQLPPNQREILARRYGLLGYKVYTLDQMSEEIGLTKERVRQAYLDSLSFIRRKLISQNLTLDVLFNN